MCVCVKCVYHKRLMAEARAVAHRTVAASSVKTQPHRHLTAAPLLRVKQGHGGSLSSAAAAAAAAARQGEGVTVGVSGRCRAPMCCGARASRMALAPVTSKTLLALADGGGGFAVVNRDPVGLPWVLLGTGQHQRACLPAGAGSARAVAGWVTTYRASAARNHAMETRRHQCGGDGSHGRCRLCRLCHPQRRVGFREAAPTRLVAQPGSGSGDDGGAAVLAELGLIVA